MKNGSCDVFSAMNTCQPITRGVPDMTNKEIRFYILSVYLLCTVLSGLADDPHEWPDNYPVQLVSVGWHDTYDTLFVPQPEGWLGADAAHSIVLDEHRTLWLFGDTFLGKTEDGIRRSQGPHINNCIAIEDRSETIPGRIEYHWRMEGDSQMAFFPPQPDMPGKYYWPTSGLIAADRLLLFCFAMDANELTWWVAGTVMIAIDNYTETPDSWTCRYYDLGVGTSSFGIHSAMMLWEDYIYFLGYQDVSAGRAAILARAPEKLFAQQPDSNLIQYWSKGLFKERWRKDHEDPVPLFLPGITESDIHYIEEWDLFLATTYDPMQPDIYLTTARLLTGPWTEPVLIYSNPEHVTMTYAARPHPALSDQINELIISYVTSPASLDLSTEGLDSYRPRFLRVILARSGE